MRINGFEQIKGFYSWVFANQDKDIKPQHTSLYVFLLNQNNRNNWIEWFKCPYDLAMAGSCISSKKTYYKCLTDLCDWGLIGYKAGVNSWKAPLIKLEVLKDTSTVPQSEPQVLQVSIPQHIQVLLQLSTPQPIHNIKLLTDNFELITNNLDSIIKKFKIVPKTALPEYAPCVEFWLKEFHIGWTFTPQSGKNLNSIIKKLRKILEDKEGDSPPEKVILLFRNMCLKLPDWYKQKDLAIIDQKFNEIISEIQNGQVSNNQKIGNSKIADIAKVYEGIKNAPTAEEIRNRQFGD